jgi:beta-glucosidase-like glycosyl hydrolase
MQLTATIVYANRSCLEVNPQLLHGVNVTLVNNHCQAPPSPQQTFTWAGAALTVQAQGVVAPFTPYPLCVALAGGGVALGTQVWAENCTGAPSQQWRYNATTRALQALGAPGMCLDIGSAWPPCSPGSAFAALPFCNQSLGLDARLDDMLARLPLHEALQQTQGNSAGAPSIGRSPWAESDFTHGAGSIFTWTYDTLASHGLVVYPAASAVAQSFNRSLWREVGLAVGDEQRAEYNAGNSALVGWSPNINLGGRDPRWGRINEVAGEDVHLMSEYVTAFVAAMQWGEAFDGAPADTRGVPLKTANTCKHFAGYGLELWNGTIRYAFNAIISRQDLYATYLPAFQACVQDAKVAMLMCAYNQVNGLPACADGELMNGIARGVWGFDGAIVSDCGAAKAVWQTDHYTNSSEAVCPLVLNAGMDCACSNDLMPLQCAVPAIADGSLLLETLLTAVRRKLSVRLRAGEFDEDTPFDALDNNTLICAPEALDRAQRAAEQSVALLKVDRARLPLNRSAIRSLAVVGPNAQGSLLGDYSSWPCGGISPTILDAVTATGVEVRYAAGCAINSSDASGIAAAEAAAGGADATLVVAGLDLTLEREGKDRYEIGLPGVQGELISRACAAARGPCVLLLVGAGSVDISAPLADANVAAVFKLAYSGIRGAPAAVRVLFGEAEPAGRMTLTTYPADYVDRISMFEFAMPPTTSAWPCAIGGTGACATPGRTYKFYTGTPVLPFGWGLGYTTFQYAALSGPPAAPLAPTAAFLAAHTVPTYGAAFAPLRGAPTVANFTLTVRNTGARDSDEVVLGFLRPPRGGSGGIPNVFLFAFERVRIAAGGEAQVQLRVSARDLSQVTASGDRVAWGGRYTIECGLRGAPEQGGGFASATFDVT